MSIFHLFDDQAPDKTSDDRRPVPPWISLSEIEKEKLITSVMFAHAMKCDLLRSHHGRFLGSLGMGIAFEEHFGKCFRSREMVGDSTDARWERGGHIYRLSIKSLEKPLVTWKNRTGATFAIVNTQSTEERWPEGLFDYLMVIGVGAETKRRSSNYGCQIGFIPESAVERRARHKKDQIQYTFHKDDCVENGFLSIDGCEWDKRWKNSILGEGQNKKELADWMEEHLDRSLRTMFSDAFKHIRSGYTSSLSRMR